MELNSLIEILGKQSGATLEYPFGDDVMVYKVMNKMFALINIKDNLPLNSMNLKCDPNNALAYRDIYENVIAGYHMNKKHWNTIYFDKDDFISDEAIIEMIEESYNLVVSKLTKKQKLELQALQK